MINGWPIVSGTTANDFQLLLLFSGYLIICFLAYCAQIVYLSYITCALLFFLRC